MFVTNVFACVCGSWLVCHKDYTKTIWQIYMQPSLRMGFSLKQTPSTFGADPDEGTNPGYQEQDGALLDILNVFNLQGKNGSQWKKGTFLVSMSECNLMWIQITLDLMDSNVFDIRSGLIVSKGTVGPWQRYVLYWTEIQLRSYFLLFSWSSYQNLRYCFWEYIVMIMSKNNV